MTTPLRACAPAGLALSESCRTVHALGWMPSTAGNLSVREADDELLITASGVDKGALTATDVVRVALDGVTCAPGEGRPSAETSIHAAIYRATDARAVVHAHPPYATTVASLVGAPDATRTLDVGGYELVKAFGRGPGPIVVPVFANLRDVASIAENVERWLGASDAVTALLIERHGVTTWGADLDEARLRMECIEALCHLLLLTGDVPTSRTSQPTT